MKNSNIFASLSFNTFLSSFLGFFTSSKVEARFTNSDIINSNTDHINFTNTLVDKSTLKTILDEIQYYPNIGHISWGDLPTDSESINLVNKIEEEIIRNNKGYKRHPSDFVHSLLSSYVYEDNVIDSIVRFNKDNKNSVHNKYLEGWKVHTVFDVEKSGKYYAVIYVNERKNQVVLAHRGTTAELVDVFKPDSPLKTDIIGVLGNEIVAQQVEAYIASKKAVTYSREQGYHLSVTGHSLGAWLAELSAYHCYKDFEYPTVKAITFDSPGSKNMLDEFKSNVDDQRINFNPAVKLDIVTYLSAPNIVNSCNKHLGRVYSVSPKITAPGSVDKYLPYLKMIPGISDNLFMLNGLLTVSGHSLDLIIEEFNPKTGKPDNYKRVLDWPEIKYESTDSVNSLLAKSIDFLPSVGLTKSAMNYVSGFIQKSISDNTMITAVIQTIYDFTKGNIKAKQYWDVFKHIEFTKEQTYEIKKDISDKNKFSLTYKGHYDVREYNPSQEILIATNSVTDWYLSTIAELFCPGEGITKKQLSALKDSFELRSDASGVYLVAKDSLTYDGISEWILRLLDVNEDIKKLLHNDNGAKYNCLKIDFARVKKEHQEELSRQVEQIQRDIKKAEQQISISPKSDTAYYHKAQALGKLCQIENSEEKCEQALKSYDKAIELAVNNKKLYLVSRSKFLTEIGKTELAIEDIKKTQSLTQGGSMIIKFYTEYTINNIIKMQEVQDGITKLQRDGKIDPEFADILRKHAEVTEELVLTVGVHGEKISYLNEFNKVNSNRIDFLEKIIEKILSNTASDEDIQKIKMHFAENKAMMQSINNDNITTLPSNYEKLINNKQELTRDIDFINEAKLLKGIADIYFEIKDDNKALEFLYRSYSVIVSNVSPYDAEALVIYDLINKHDRQFFDKSIFRSFISEPSPETELTIEVKTMIQESVLNKIASLASNGSWNNKNWGLSAGVKDLTEDSYLQNQLGNLASEETIKIAKKLAFEAINLGIMHSKDKKFACTEEFTKAYPELVLEIARENPDYFVDCYIIHKIRSYIDDSVISALISEDDTSFVKGLYEAEVPFDLYSGDMWGNSYYQISDESGINQIHCIGFNFGNILQLSGHTPLLHDEL